MMAEPLRVLVCSPTGAGEHYNGPAASTFRLLSGMDRNHFVFTLLHASTQQETFPALFSQQIGLPAVHGAPASRLGRLRYIACSVSFMIRHARDYDIVYTPMANILTMAPALAARSRGIPVIGRIAAAKTELTDSGNLRRALRWSRLRVALLGRLSAVIAISKEIELRLEELGMPRSMVFYLPNSADCQRFRPASAEERLVQRRRFGVPRDALVAVCVGALSQRKGQHLIIEALAQAPESVHALLVGPATPAMYRVQLEALARDVGVAHRVHFTGHIADVENAYKASDIFVLASNDEGMPNAMVEAMASGLPSIGTRISGTTDLIGVEGRPETERGLLVERDSASVAMALAQMVNDETLRMEQGQRALAYVLEHHSRATLAKCFAAIVSALTISRALTVGVTSQKKGDARSKYSNEHSEETRIDD